MGISPEQKIEDRLAAAEAKLKEARGLLTSLGGELREAKRELKEIGIKKKNFLQVRDAVLLAERVCYHFGVKYEDEFRSDSRNKRYAVARSLFTEIALQRDYPPELVGMVMNRERTVVYNCKKNMAERVKNFPVLRELVESGRKKFARTTAKNNT